MDIELKRDDLLSDVLPLRGQCWPFRLARTLSGFSLRRKGAIPRFIGRMARYWIHHAFVTSHGALIPLAANALDVFVAMSRQSERIHWRSYQTREEARADIVEYITMFYNSRRLHSYLDYQSPDEFERNGRVADVA